MHNDGPRVLLYHEVPSESSKKIEIMFGLSLVFSLFYCLRSLWMLAISE